MTKRLTDWQKKELLQKFKSGNSIEVLSKEFDCTKLTVTRNLKKLLGDLKYKELITENKSLKGKSRIGKKKPNSQLDIKHDYKGYSEKSENFQNLKEKKDDPDFTTVESFFEIAPLDCEIENSTRKELSSIPLSEVDLPKVVYMIVNKNIELEIKLLSDFPEWDFLPKVDLERKTIEIYFDLNIAKRSCKKEQKVIKVPNPNVFRIASPILISRGISRIVSSEKLIAL